MTRRLQQQFHNLVAVDSLSHSDHPLQNRFVMAEAPLDEVFLASMWAEVCAIFSEYAFVELNLIHSQSLVYGMHTHQHSQ